jgi:hypothetical protein
MPNFGVKVWFSSPDDIAWYKETHGACYQLPTEQTKLLTTEASNENHARMRIENMIEKTWGISKDKFEVVEVRQLN